MPFGLDPNSADTSQDGIIDGLAVYGSDDLPLPNLGVIAEQKNIVVEVDHIVGMELNSNRRAAIQATGYALDEVSLNFIGLTGEYATYPVTSCEQECHFIAGRGWICGSVCEDIEVPVVPPSNVTSTIPDSEIGPEESCGATCLEQASPGSSFNLNKFPFVRRIAWAYIYDACGSAKGPETSGIGRYGIVKCDGTTFAHELGHMLGLGHGGRNDVRPYKPNYWSVMSNGMTLPMPEGGYMLLETEESASLGFTKGRPARFSNSNFGPVNENALDEEAGITGGHCLNQDCSDYSAPYTFESVRNPYSPPPGQISPYWADVTVGWLDWEVDGEINPNPVIMNIDSQCEYNEEEEEWTNKNADATGPTQAICYEKLQPKNDHDFFKYEMHAYNWTICENLDAQRDELGLNPVTNCTTPLLPFHLLPTNEISCE
ncbi:hypothetical protein DFR33_108141 [Bradymonas sediminis]|uniref:Uncharacterized protein n=2 Tax=Bradymonas sediminis TaxID=1548548 RepID=A0A2Z4FJ00_9DELT|nr:hypothetical protein DN745_06025 [Bradymonas sediminis]TDP71927.1 hypothetical protein DFR33_108141 [Bradymonas sediminis]